MPGWQNDTLLFAIAALAVIPLAGWLGRATEHLAERAGPGVGGLLNATFGNAAELIIGLLALSHGLIGVVKASITGSIIGNILLVLGASMLAGGFRFSRQRFNQTAARVSSTSLTLAAIGLIIPTIFHLAADQQPGGWSPQAEQRLSLAIAAVLFMTYLLSLVFSLVTHKDLFAAMHCGRPEQRTSWPDLVGGQIAHRAHGLHRTRGDDERAARRLCGSGTPRTRADRSVRRRDCRRHHRQRRRALHRDFVALKNKMDLSLGIAIGSSLQIALFVTPVLVFASYLFGQPMNLEFSFPEMAAVVFSVWIVGEISGDGECNWLEGAQLLSVYLIIAILFFFLPEPSHVTQPVTSQGVTGTVSAPR